MPSHPDTPVSRPSSLLFGQRRIQPPSPRRRRKLAAAKRRRTLETRQRTHQQSIADAGSALLGGDSLHLKELLEQDTPKGSLQTERQALRKLSEDLYQNYLRSHRSGSTPAALDLDTIDALQALRRRMDERRLPMRHQDLVRQSVLAVGRALVGQELTERLLESADEIGTLPRVWRSRGSVTSHLRHPEHELLLCGYEWKSSVSQWDPATVGETTPLMSAVTCSACCANYGAGVIAASYSVPEWLECWHNNSGRFYRSSRAFSWIGPDQQLDANEIYSVMLDERCDEIDTDFSKLGLEAPPLLVGYPLSNH